MPLEGFLPIEWVCFEHVLIMKDVSLGGPRTFLSSEDARMFRQMAYTRQGLPAPAPRLAPPVITYQKKMANRRIVNEVELVEALREFGQVRTMAFDASSSFEDQLEAVRETGIFVSVHTSNLANAAFLWPGSVVIEILQRHWSWEGMGQGFKDHTKLLADVHHFGLRAQGLNETLYLDPRDHRRWDASGST
eukprot:evm.model.scf_234.8 EVM.evm.TU.scf_234.8   scf_234:85003-87809(-)